MKFMFISNHVLGVYESDLSNKPLAMKRHLRLVVT